MGCRRGLYPPRPDGALDLSSVDYKIGEYDRNAIEEAVRQRDAGGGGSVIGVTVGTPDSAKGVKDGFPAGMDQAFFASDAAFRDLEPSQTARFSRRSSARASRSTISSPAARARATSTPSRWGRGLPSFWGSPASALSRSSPSRAESSGRSACRGRHRGGRGAASCLGDGAARHQHAADPRREGHADGRQETRHDRSKRKSLRGASRGH